ncbi:hypothetical protein F9K91_18430 [Brucella tritici]|uniref:Uncharacterized protein n=1 Tax=Brucella tritici TaxID=94626 RepID=A0A833CIB5_9HYPH|nr:hypothetical protein [Brucella tritici]KAB2663395.1 hypothetical protein F9K91_18430 [Brucella tritici]
MTIYAAFKNDGSVSGFWDTDFISDTSVIPADAIEVSDEQRREFLEFPSTRRWHEGAIIEFVCVPPLPTVETYRQAVQSKIDAKAHDRQYDSGATLASYVNSTMPEWATEAQAFIGWRDCVWAYALNELDKVQQGSARSKRASKC